MSVNINKYIKNGIKNSCKQNIHTYISSSIQWIMALLFSVSRCMLHVSQADLICFNKGNEWQRTLNFIILCCSLTFGSFSYTPEHRPQWTPTLFIHQNLIQMEEGEKKSRYCMSAMTVPCCCWESRLEIKNVHSRKLDMAHVSLFYSLTSRGDGWSTCEVWTVWVNEAYAALWAFNKSKISHLAVTHNQADFN